MENRGPELSGVIVAFFLFALIPVLLRCYVRVCLTKSFSYDDILMVLTMIVYTAGGAVTLNGVHHGIGKRSTDISPNNYSVSMKMWYLCQVFYGVSSVLLKLSVGALLLRLATQKTHIWIIRCIMILSTVCGLLLAFELIFQCMPIRLFWSPVPEWTPRNCVSPETTIAFCYAHAAIAASTDFTFAILPFFMFRDLKGTRKRWTVIMILSIANIGALTTLIRMKTISMMAIEKDFLYSAIGLAIWSFIEIGTGIHAASLATLRPLVFIFSSFTQLGSGDRSKNTKSRESKAPGIHVSWKVSTRATTLPDGDAPGTKEKSWVTINSLQSEDVELGESIKASDSTVNLHTMHRGDI